MRLIIEDNPISAVNKANEEDYLALLLAEIFAWDVDFNTDLRRGDTFKIIFEKKYLKNDAKIFIVANDRLRLYPEIAKRSGLKIVKEFHRAVTKRTEQGDNPYQETIFYMQYSQ